MVREPPRAARPNISLIHLHGAVSAVSTPQAEIANCFLLCAVTMQLARQHETRSSPPLPIMGRVKKRRVREIASVDVGRQIETCQQGSVCMTRRYGNNAMPKMDAGPRARDQATQPQRTRSRPRMQPTGPAEACHILPKSAGGLGISFSLRSFISPSTKVNFF